MPKSKITLTQSFRNSLLTSVLNLKFLLDNMECGCSYWVDFEGRSHTADIGYVSEFLDDLEKYLKGEWEDKSEEIIKTKPFPYNYIAEDKDGNFTNDYCYRFCVKEDCIEFDQGDGLIGYANFSEIGFLKIIEIATGKMWIFDTQKQELVEVVYE